MITVAKASNVTSPDFVPLEKRRQGLYIRTFKVAADGTRYDDSGFTVVDSDPDSYAYHPAATWPPCQCPLHGG
ncbi:hypothetical protein ACFY00_25625 [Kitasatospora sp. NPDC001540]|uniref:hypothetical protein n=1 Tax=Kitasatospora sp. NPDC001540 TaxID=3364014 RepID=UPI0036AD47EE